MAALADSVPAAAASKTVAIRIEFIPTLPLKCQNLALKYSCANCGKPQETAACQGFSECNAMTNAEWQPGFFDRKHMCQNKIRKRRFFLTSCSSHVPGPALGGLLVCLLAFAGSAFSGTPHSNESANNHPAPSLVNEWNMKVRHLSAERIQLSFRPLVSSAKKFVGADHHTDGKTLWVTLKSCPVTEDCVAMSPALPMPGEKDRFTHRVVLPYGGERVMVQGQGNKLEELPLSR